MESADTAILEECCRYLIAGTESDTLHLAVGDGVQFLANYDWQGDEYVYCDPPYLFGARRSQKKLYGCEFGTEEERKLLLSTLLAVSARGVNVGISGYDNPLYEAMLPGWRKIQWQVNTRGNRMATETLWMNYPEGPLHDYSYVGDNYRERERIAKKKARWIGRLQRMPDAERFALIEAVASFGDNGQLADDRAQSDVTMSDRRSVVDPQSPETAVAPRGENRLLELPPETAIGGREAVSWSFDEGKE